MGGVLYVKWDTYVAGGAFEYCSNVLEDVEVQRALGNLGEKQVQLYMTRLLLFPSPTPWYGAEDFVRRGGRPIPMKEYYSASTALVVAILASLASVYVAWRLGRAGRLRHFVVPCAVVGGTYGLSAFFQRAAAVAVGGELSPLQWLTVLWPAVPPALYALVFYLTWRRRTA